MGKNARSVLYHTLKDAGWVPDKKFVSYTEAELRGIAVERGIDLGDTLTPPAPPEAEAPEPAQAPDTSTAPETPEPAPPHDPDVIRIDEQGRMWYQEEVRKPAYPKPRGRRVLQYLDPGVKTQTIQSGEYIETIEVAGDRVGRPSEVKITLPSYQVGIYKDPRFPFRVHVYNDRHGFALQEVEAYFGGSELTPRTCKRIYIENDLCYDIRSVVQTIEAQYRELVLRGQA